jgi:hypothetical protein
MEQGATEIVLPWVPLKTHYGERADEVLVAVVLGTHGGYLCRDQDECQDKDGQRECYQVDVKCQGVDPTAFALQGCIGGSGTKISKSVSLALVIDLGKSLTEQTKCSMLE